VTDKAKEQKKSDAAEKLEDAWKTVPEHDRRHEQKHGTDWRKPK